MHFREISSLVQIQVKNGSVERKTIIEHLRKLGYKNIEPSTISRCFKEEEIKIASLSGKEIRIRELINLDDHLLKILGNRQIILSESYFRKILEKFREREQEFDLEIAEEVIKILVAFGKRGKTVWNAFFKNVDDLLDENGNLTTRSSYLKLKRFIDRNTNGNINITLSDVKKSLPCLEKLNWKLFQCYRSLRVVIFLIEKNFVNRSEIVLSLTEKVNEIVHLPFQRKYKPHQIKRSLKKLAEKELIAFPESYSERTKKEVMMIYKQSQGLIKQLLLDPVRKAKFGKNYQKKAEFKLLSRIFITLLHEFFIITTHIDKFFHWWHDFGKHIVNDMQNDLLRDGRRSETYLELLRVKLLLDNEKKNFQEITKLFSIEEAQLQILQKTERAPAFLFSLMNFLMKYFLGANHFRLKKAEYGFIPIYTGDVIQMNFDSYAEGLHMGNFQAIEFLRLENYSDVKKTRFRQRKLFMDLFLGELLEACIVKTLIKKTAPRTLVHKFSDKVLEEMEMSKITDEKAILIIIITMKKSVFFADYHQALRYLRDLVSSSALKTKLEEEINEIWTANNNLNCETGKRAAASNSLKEHIEKKISEILLLGREVIFPSSEKQTV
ncbi:MAG: hypothetical protein ACXADA_09575 [Candidatus Hodarchaeales archaeon]